MTYLKRHLKELLFPLCLLTAPLVQAQNYEQLHQQALVVDTHNDVLISVLRGLDLADDLSGQTHSDLARFKKGGVDVQVFSIWCDETYGKGTAFNFANQQIDSLYSIARRNPDKMQVVATQRDLEQVVQQQKLAAMIGVEGGHMIEDNLAYLDSLHARGARYMTLTWNNSTSWASSAADEVAGNIPANKRGLNDFGKQVVTRMNELGMLVDLSHVGERTFWDAINTSTKPVLVSHSCVHSIAPHSRNLKDDQIKAVAKNGGVIHLNFYSAFLDKKFNARQEKFNKKYAKELAELEAQNMNSSGIASYMTAKYPKQFNAVRPPLSLLVDHLDYVVKLVGVDYVGIGSDFDGITSTPRGLDSVADLPLFTKELVARGYSEQDIRKILGGNFMRVLEANGG